MHNYSINKHIPSYFLICSLTTLGLITDPAYSHGTLETPISRVYNCFKEGPENPKSAACKAAVAAGGTQALYDWNGINQGAANDRHQQLIPDGMLCSGGRDIFKGMNLARSDWPTTTIGSDETGKMRFTWIATAPHATKYFKFYLSKASYNFAKPLTWADLESPFCTINQVTLNNGRYNFECPAPAASGRRILYTIWQRSDSMEAFYSCSDIQIASTSTVPWSVVNDVYAYQDLLPNSKVVLRVFKNGVDTLSHSVTLGLNQTSKTQWPYYLAKSLNQNSSLVNMGVLNSSTGEINPSLTLNANKVYVKSSDANQYQVAFDIYNPTGPNPTPSCINANFNNSVIAGWANITLTVTNSCTSTVDFRDAAITFTNNTAINTTFWGTFTPMSYPINTNITSQAQADGKFSARIPLTFGTESWVVTKLPAGRSFTIKYGQPTVAYNADTVRVSIAGTPAIASEITLNKQTARPTDIAATATTASGKKST